MSLTSFTSFTIGFAGGSLFLFVFLFFALRNTTRRHQVIVEILKRLLQEYGPRLIFHVRYASAERFRKTWKFLPWEAAGILYLGDEGIIFSGQLLSGEAILLVFPCDHTKHRWVGRKSWPNGSISWFELSEESASHFFSSETGMWTPGSETTTKQLYEIVSAELAT